MPEVDVLVVGAGPAGLSLACALRAHGVSVRVLDGASGPATTSRANILHARGVEVLDRLGALGDLAENAVTALSITAYVGGRPVSRLRFGDVGLGTSRPALLVSQAAVEDRLRSRLAALGVEIEWAARVSGLRPAADGVTATVEGRQSVQAGWVVGCDGAHSTVRRLTGIGFPGAPVADQFLLGDVHMSWVPDRSGSHGWMHPDGLVGAMPMYEQDRDDLWRLLVYLPGETEGELDDQEILERLRKLVPQRTGHPEAVIHDGAWLSLFRIHRRLVDSYRSGRVLLAGDAAHVHSPIGGQGMLTGIGDAENLGWKLALVVRGMASDALLDTYQAERRPLAAGVVRNTSANTRFQTGTGPVVRLLRERVATPLLSRPAVQRWATAVASQLWVSYRRGPLAGATARFGRRPRQGDRVPDLPCNRPDGSGTRLHAELGGRWALIGGSVPAAVVGAVRARVGEVATLTCVPTRAGEVWLVRPDAHLAWRGAAFAPGLHRWLDGALSRGTVR
ncbi:FAD-dependent monooxygenase [Pseudonocardia sp. DLS-67]